MPVIHMTPDLHPVGFAKMQEMLGAYEVIPPEPAPTAGNSNAQGGKVEIVKANMWREEAELSSGHRLIIDLLCVLSMRRERSLVSNSPG